MRKDAYNLLFNQLLGKREEPLFSSQADLARVIFKEVEDNSFKSIDSIKSYINRVLKDDKPSSDTLTNAILEAIKLRLKKSVHFDSVKAEFVKAISNIDNFKHEKLSESSYEESLLKIINSEGHHVIISDYPHEHLETNFSKRIIQNIVKNLGVVDGETRIFKYEYYVKDENTAIIIWKIFEKEIRQKTGKEQTDVDDILIDLYKVRKSLRIFYSTPYIASHNLYLLNIRADNPKAIKMYNQSNIKINIPEREISNIVEYIYIPLKATLRHEVVFECDYKPHVEFENKSKKSN